MSLFRSFYYFTLICVWKHCCCGPIIPDETLYVIFNYINKHHLLQPPAKFWLKQHIWQVTNHHLEVLLYWWLLIKKQKCLITLRIYQRLWLAGRKESCLVCQHQRTPLHHLVCDDLAETEITSISKTNRLFSRPTRLFWVHVCMHLWVHAF